MQNTVVMILCTSPITIIPIIYGLLAIGKRDWLWKMHQDGAISKGLAVRRTPEWDKRQAFQGWSLLVFGLVMLGIIIWLSSIGANMVVAQ